MGREWIRLNKKEVFGIDLKRKSHFQRDGNGSVQAKGTI